MEGGGHGGDKANIGIWVHQDGWRIAASGRSDAEPAPQGRLREPEKFNTNLYPPPEKAAGEIAAALQTAGKGA